MKKIVFLLTLLVASLNLCQAQNAAQLMQKGNEAYTNSDYKQAIVNYTQILNGGEHNANLYYNLGNAYFKEGKIGAALLNYYRAEKLEPGNEDIKYNIAVTSAQVKDKIDVVPEFFVKTWIKTFRASLSSTAWAILSLVFLTITLSFVMLYLLASVISMRKIGFYMGMFFGAFFMITLIFATVNKNIMTNPTEAIVMISAAPVKASPDQGSKDVFVLHEGTKVKIVREFDSWSEVMIADGNKGWMQKAAIELID